jgi:phospholipase/carboxylesterase
MLVGFSQGTMISLNIGLRNTSILAGIVGFSGKILMPDSLKAEKKNDYPPVLLVHGDNDQVVPIAFLKEAIEILQFLRVDHKTHVSKNVAHGISQDGLEQALVFMKDIFK